MMAVVGADSVTTLPEMEAIVVPTGMPAPPTNMPAVSPVASGTVTVGLPALFTTLVTIQEGCKVSTLAPDFTSARELPRPLSAITELMVMVA